MYYVSIGSEHVQEGLQVRRTVLGRDIDGRGETIISWMCRSISTYLSLIFSYGIHLSICKYLLLRVTPLRVYLIYLSIQRNSPIVLSHSPGN